MLVNVNRPWIVDLGEVDDYKTQTTMFYDQKGEVPQEGWEDDVGLVKQIRALDIQDTDLYVFRASDGVLVAEKSGVRTDEIGLNFFAKDEMDPAKAPFARLRYNMMVKSGQIGLLGEQKAPVWCEKNANGECDKFPVCDPAETACRYAKQTTRDDYVSKYGNELGLETTLFVLYYADKSSHKKIAESKYGFVVKELVDPNDQGAKNRLRKNEEVLVYAINRTTGYIGKAVGTMGGDGNLQGIAVGDIVMRPPNLEIASCTIYQPTSFRSLAIVKIE
jgi:hypothetical protein